MVNVYGYIVPSKGYEDKKVPTLGFIAHMDTAPAATGENVNPQVIRKLRWGRCYY